MVVTMLEAEVLPDRTEELETQFLSAPLPPAIVESFLLASSDSTMWRLVTVWESKAALDEYRANVETPGGVLMFRSAQAEPTLTVFETRGHSTHA